MLAAVNTIALERPLEESVFEAAQRDMPARTAAVDGIEIVVSYLRD